MEKDIYRSQFRMPQELFEKLKASADSHHRSVNAELVAILQASLDGPPSDAPHRHNRQLELEDIAERAADILDSRNGWRKMIAEAMAELNRSPYERITGVEPPKNPELPAVKTVLPPVEPWPFTDPPPKPRAPRKPKA